ncbi:hypothetical protein DTO166G4_653 [Paecilomyces variotii]|nr:hypothetical protein DTO164E3_6064 [Paecilomyces variotii]KAJ9217849.1 hypothetical protein DTO166G4_653 [Paecilomyces variotii]KAJ9238883.1 hypothetical protein DTO166G5_2679 [Paecilomyces variotii]KAJ9243808.1 hypothetical protein DTO169E5_2437 [Paecilomyces variotii]KAJ9247404.1 hypothetical protein DTO207G8_8103 [Paecilomyces variotii]
MADAVCGPSNPLQNFRKHASTDRTLQQDRLTARPSPAQGFRSANLNAGVLDSEFEAFEANLAGPPPSLQHPVPFGVHSRHGPMFSAGESSNWAADFQRLQVSDGPPMHAQHHFQPANISMAGPSQRGWHEEFVRQQQGSPAQLHQPSHSPAFQQPMHYPMTGGMSSFVPHATQAAPQNAHPAETQVFDESSFEAAFAQARAEMELQETTATQETTTVASTPQVDAVSTEQPLEQIRIGSDTIPYVEKDSTEGRVDDSDALAKTAGQLLESVSHDQSQKFKESNFLALMRRIRDREVRVEGDEFRDVSAAYPLVEQSLHPGGKYYPADYRSPSNHESQPAANITGDDDADFERGAGNGIRNRVGGILSDTGGSDDTILLESPSEGTDTSHLYEIPRPGKGTIDRGIVYPMSCFFRKDLEALGPV